jgi:hypothetical protein
MRKTTAAATTILLTLSLAGPATSAGAAVAGPAAAPSGVNPKYQVCDPNDWPGSNPKYPFSFMLTTKYANTSNANIRAAVKSIQRVIDYRVWGDQLTSSHPVFVTVDGKYGPKTAAAVKKFQKATGLLADGKVGKVTWATLAAYCGSD